MSPQSRQRVRTSQVPQQRTTDSAASRYAAEQKAWRERMGLDQKGFAQALGFSIDLIRAVEQCKRTPTEPYASRCDAVTEAPGTFARWQAQVVEASYPSFFAPVIELERNAACIHGWELGAIPGLLQTEAYARAQIRVTRPYDSEDKVEATVSGRIRRQEILTREQPPVLWYVLDESILHRIVGSTQIMSEQLDHVLTACGRPGMVVQVLTFATGEGIGADGPISVYEFSDSPTVCYTECYRGGRLIEDRAEVAEMMTKINHIRVSALSPRASIERIREIRSRIND